MEPRKSKPEVRQPDTMTLAELAQRLEISLTVAYRLVQEDALPVPRIRVGREWRFSRIAYEQVIRRQHPPEKEAWGQDRRRGD